MKSKTVKLVSGVAVLAVLSCAYLGVVSYVDSQEKKEAETQNTSVSLVDIEPENITSVSFPKMENRRILRKKKIPGAKKEKRISRSVRIP